LPYLTDSKPIERMSDLSARHSPIKIQEQLKSLDPRAESYASDFVELLLRSATDLRATDIHLRPTSDFLDISLRIDGVLQQWGGFRKGAASDITTRLKVVADLLTYRNDVPQEGRVRNSSVGGEVRDSTFPTLHGEKVAVRLFSAESPLEHLAELGLPDDIRQLMQQKLCETSGALLITGPAGSGKTTTAYACLRELVRTYRGARSIATLEDPIEMSLPGVAQSQVRPTSEFDLQSGLRSLLRQDPEVIFIGEMRDPVTAATAMQASLTGQLVLTTFHAGSAAGSINRLLDMGLEPYMLRSGVLAVLCQRLVRRLCTCSEKTDDDDAKLGLPVNKCRQPRGCSNCHETGYRERLLLVEALTLDDGKLASAVLQRKDAAELERLAVATGMKTRWTQAIDAVEAGLTSPAEVRRVLGFSNAFSAEP
jgi:general secretion pathway protein E